MPENEKTIWGIHAGKTGDADSLFLKKNYIALLATVLMFALPAIHAAAGCPESLSQESMAELIKKHFQNEIPKDSERAFSELMRSGVISPFFARPPSGPAPLTVDLRWFNYPVQDPTRIQFDANGDGTPEWVESSWEPAAERRQYTYIKPGEYQATVLVYDRMGNLAHSATQRVRVVEPKLFDKELRGYWDSLREALRRKDLKAALHCIHSRYRSELEARLSETMSGGAKRIAQDLGDLEFIEQRSRFLAFYIRSVPEGGVDVYFEPDYDGYWRISRF